MARWDDRLLLAGADPRAAIARALERAGSRVVGVHDGGRPGRTYTSSYHYDCGCVRTYKANAQTHEEAEYLTPCGGHRDLVNLLTEGAEQTTIGGTQQEANRQ